MASVGTTPRFTVELACSRYVAEQLMPKTAGRHIMTYVSYLGLIREHFGASTYVDAINDTKVADWWAALLNKVEPRGNA